MRPDSIKLSRRHKIAFYSVLGVVFASGAIWTWLHYFVQTDSGFSSARAQVWTLTIHGLSAAMWLLLIGSLVPLHVKYAWRARRNRTNGVFFISIVTVLIITGYGLYYIGNEQLRSWTSWIHLVVGLALPFLLIFHIWRGRVSRRIKRFYAPTRGEEKVLVK
jgi:hypothetical protein